MIVIRRELPPTKNAGPVEIDLSHRCGEDSPFRVPCDLCPQCPIFIASLPPLAALLLCGAFSPLRLSTLHAHPDGPDEAQHLARHRGHHLLLRLSFAQQVPI